jgi:small subunit ribosomal protein S6
MRRYETVVILDPESTDGDIQDFTDRYRQLITDGGGEAIKIDSWGVRKLAYLVKKKEKGRYMLMDYLGEPELIAELERLLRLSEDVLKFLSVKIEDDVDLEAFRAKVAEEKAAAEKAKAEAEAKAQADAEAKAKAEEEAEAKAQEEAEKEAQEATEAVPEERAESTEAKAEETTAPEEPADQPVVPADDTPQASAEPDTAPAPDAADAPETTKEGE